MEEKIIDPREPNNDRQADGMRTARLTFKLNHTMPYTDEREVKIGKRVMIMNNCLMMSAGGITIDDDVMIAANVQLITNNHDPYDRHLLHCKPVHICRGAWIGAGSSILPGVTVGEYAIVGAGSIVTKDVPPYAVVVGSPARVVKYLDKEKFLSGI